MSSLSSDLPAALAEEQQHLTLAYRQLDALREQAHRHLATANREAGGTPHARSHRDAVTARYAERLAQLAAVEQGLCFGRLDLHGDEGALHIGRIGMHDTEEPLLIDWRAPAARPFYTATAITPEKVQRRRHIRTRDRTVVGLDDEILDMTVSGGKTAGGKTLTGEAALLAALTASRTGRMRDIVETIQAEQDSVIRSGLGGVLVVQGGPGTGKTAVALHRAAYLLYTYREQLSSRGVLIIGPNATFLRYISQVLPSLAETGVLLATPGDLFPGIIARRPEPPAAAEVKGRAEMVEILLAAVRDRERVPESPLTIVVDRHRLTLDPAPAEAARDRARASGRLHNLARPIFAGAVLDALAAQVADRIGYDPFWDDPLGEDDALPSDNVLDDADRADLRVDLAAAPEVRAVLDELWPVLTPQQLLSDLFADEAALDRVAPGLSPAERALLHRQPGGDWAPSDVPLLDEAAELLGEDDRAARLAAAREQRERLDYAQGILDITAGSKAYELEDDDEAAIPNVSDVMEADMLAERLAEREWRSASERAAADRNWMFGHVIVDEAQELSPMMWRLLMRRCPSRSMTVVGDLAQTGALGVAGNWDAIFSPYVQDRWRLAELTVSYRTPAEIMAYTGRVLPDFTMPRPVREAGVDPWEHTGEISELPALVGRELAEVGAGRLAVIAPAARIAELTALLPGISPDDLEEHAVLLTVAAAKGLEFDSVIVVDPDAIRTESPRGPSDLYVALTRSTYRLGVLHPAPAGGAG
ncbi:ATP-binding domain-containing protein [Actinoplanes sp. NPDC023936]|uniref:HelD family protein n=1 Tax=Actinoplanes sp. NPDC023936 TaxID=3154910 RepID=UPI0033E80D63